MYRSLVFALGLVFVLSIVLSCAGVVIADSPQPLIRTGRYAALVATPSDAQMDPLQDLVTVSFPPPVVSVEQALVQLLAGSGYRLVAVTAEAMTEAEAEAETDPENTVADPDLAWLLTQPLPRVHRQLGPMSLAEALRVLGGPAFRPVVDHLHRRVTFETTTAYRAMTGEH